MTNLYIMKTYIAPNTDMINLSSEGIMQTLTINTTSTAPTISSGTDIE